MSALRRYVVPLGILAAAIVLYLTAPLEALGLGSLEPSKDVFTILSIVFWILAIVLFLAPESLVYHVGSPEVVASSPELVFEFDPALDEPEPAQPQSSESL